MAKILIIDDDENLRNMLSDLFFSLNPDHQVRTARDGIEGVLAAKEFLPDLILTDVEMPKMTGHEVCKKLKEDPATAGIPILMLTGANDLESALGGLGCGADDHLTKPFDLDEVAARAQALLKGR